jgi:hypothetical protein
MDLTALGRFHIAPGYDPSLPDTWVWTDRSADVRQVGSGAAITIAGDRADEISEVNPGSGQLEVDNAGGHYCTQNPYGRWYGLLARNCPARWGTISGAEAWTANTTNGWGTPDVGTSWSLEGTASNWSSSGGIGIWTAPAGNTPAAADLVGADARNGDATFTCAVSAVATGAALRASLLARRAGASNNLLFIVEFGVSGALSARIALDQGAGVVQLSTASAGTYTAGQRFRARCVWSGKDLRMRVWPEAGSEPTTWTTTATNSTLTGAKVGLHAWSASGNTNTTPQIRFDDLQIEAVEIEGTIPAFPVRWDPTATQSWAPLEIAGILRRLGQGSPALRSAMYRQITQYSTLIGHWPLEDPSGSTQLTNTVPGGAAGSVFSTTLGNTDAPPGAVASAQSTLLSVMSGVFKASSSTAGWQFAFSNKLAQAAPAAQTEMIRWTTTNGYTWAWHVSTGSYRLLVTKADVTLLDTGSILFGTGITPLEWVQHRVKVSASGGTVTVEYAWFDADMNTFGFTSTFSGTTGALATWRRMADNATVDGLLCHVFGVTGVADDLQSYNAESSFNGYINELAADRVGRLCQEEGVRVAVEAGSSEPMGPQRIGSLPDLLRAAEAGDLGVLYEAGAGLGYRPRGGRYNRAVDIALAISVNGDIADPPEPTDDDQKIRNEWTVGRDGGSEATYSDDDHIALNGRYPDQATINIASDSQLIYHAAWRVHLGTWGEMRWPQLTVDLTGNAALLAAWRGRPFGPRITVSGVPSQGPVGADLDLIVEGWSQQITSTTWLVTLNCSPAKAWDVAVYDSVTAARYDSEFTTLNAGVSAAATGYVLTFPNLSDAWSTDSTQQPFDQLISGERVRVPVGGMGAVTGSGPYTQTVTGATRAINGISKALPAGAEVHVANPGRYAL